MPRELHVRALINAGLVFEAAGCPLKAVSSYTDALALQPDSALANTCLAAVKLKQGDNPVDCLHIARRAVAAEPELLIAVVTLVCSTYGCSVSTLH